MVQYTLSGEFIQEYISAAEAAKHIQYNSSAVSSAAKGKFKACGPYIFIYKELFTKELLQEKVQLAKTYKPRKIT